MIIREYIDLDTENKKRLFADISCDVCQTTFKRQVRFVKSHTCSERCRHIQQGTRVVTNCGNCGKSFDLPKSRKLEVNYCSRTCKDKSAIISNYRKKAFAVKGESCERCGFNNKLALEVHHKDRNRTNNNISNSEVLCANCHRIEHLGD